MFEGNAIIGQSGGPTSVINASLCGVIQTCLQKGSIGESTRINKILGMKYGIEGFMQDQVIDLGVQPADVIEGLKTTPASALGSCRYKLKEADTASLRGTSYAGSVFRRRSTTTSSQPTTRPDSPLLHATSLFRSNRPGCWRVI